MIYKDLFDLDDNICKEIFLKNKNEIEVVNNLKNDILITIKNLNKKDYKEIEKDVWVGKNVIIDKSSTIIGPCIIDDNTVLRPNSYIRGNAIIGKNCVIGNSVEIKNAVIFNNCQIPHFNYVGDSIIGNNSHLGAGAIISNLKNDKSNIVIKEKENIATNMRKFGAIIGKNVNVGCNCVICPGTVIKNNVNIYPLVMVRGVIEENTILKK